MSKLRNFAVGIFSLAFVLSGFGGLAVNTASALIAPTLTSAEAKNTAVPAAKAAGDKVELEFSEQTNEYDIDEDNIDDILVLSNNHSWLDGAGNLGDVDWDSDGRELTITLSGGTSLPTVSPGDTITISTDNIENTAGDEFEGTVTITGRFIESDVDNDDDEDENEDCDMVASSRGENDDDDCADNSGPNTCANPLQNGKLYKIGAEPTVYLAVRHCILKPFRGAAAFHARGHKFSDIIMLPSLPAGVTLSTAPALPVEGTLIKGSDKTVWFISHEGKRRGFVSAEVFTRLGFKFDQIKQISDSDLNELPTDTTNVSDGDHHPDGSLIKCGNSPAVFLVVAGRRKAFTSAEVFQGRGHSFEHILQVDCGRFAYSDDSPVSDVD